MDVATMRKVDRWLGVPMCALLSLHGRIYAPQGPEREGPPRSILFVKLAEQGSTVLAYRAIRRAVEMVGAENVHFLVFEPNRFILDVMEVIPPENVITISTDSMAATMRTSLAAVRKMRRLELDAAIDMEFFARSTAIFTYLSGARKRVGLHAYAGDGPYRGDLMTHRLVYNPHIHTARTFESLVEALEHPGNAFPAFPARAREEEDRGEPSFRPREDEVETVRSIICETAGRDSVPPLVLLNANCSDLLPLRKWPDANYVALARRLLEHNGDLCVAFTGAPEEAGPVEHLVREIGSNRCFSMAGKTTLRQLLVLYGLSKVLITNDSGPAHFATLTPVDVITLFGPETPELFGAPTLRNHVIWAGLACSPCVSAYNNRLSRCTNNLCMQAITMEEVFHKAVEVLERTLLTANVHKSLTK